MDRGKVQYYSATTLDGFIADEQSSLEWLFEVRRENDEFASFFAGLGAFVMGRSTFDWIAKHEDLYQHPQKWAEWYGEMPCWVFTNRKLDPIPNAKIHVVSGPVRPVFEEIAAAAGEKNIWLAGGGRLAGAFADAGLIDELILQFAPVILGGGAPLLPRRILSARLELVEAKQNGQFVDARYRFVSPAPKE